MKLKQSIPYYLIFIGICFSVHAETESVTSSSVEEIAEAVVENNNINSNSEENNSDDLIKKNGLESTNSKTEADKPKGPAVGYVPETAIKRFNGIYKNDVTKYDFEKTQAKIYQFEKKGNHEKAMELLRELNNKHPDNKSTIRLARLLLKTGDFKQAEIEIKPLCHIPNPLWQSCFLLGTAQLMNKQLDAAAQSFDRALLSDVEQAVIWLNRAIVEQERNDHDAAIQLLSIAHNLKPENSNIVLNLAISNEAVGNTDIAFQFYKQFLQLSSTSPEHKSLRFSILSHLTTLQVANQ